MGFAPDSFPCIQRARPTRRAQPFPFSPNLERAELQSTVAVPFAGASWFSGSPSSEFSGGLIFFFLESASTKSLGRLKKKKNRFHIYNSTYHLMRGLQGQAPKKKSHHLAHAPRHPSPEVGGFSSKADDKMGSREVVSPAPD